MRAVIEKEIALIMHEIVLVLTVYCMVFVGNITDKLLMCSAVAMTTHFCITRYKLISVHTKAR